MNSRHHDFVRIVLLAAAFAFVSNRIEAQDEPLVETTPTADAIVQSLVNDNPIPTKNLLQVIRDGGALMMPIGICSFLLMVFVFERAIALRRGRVIPGPFVNRFLDLTVKQWCRGC